MRKLSNLAHKKRDLFSNTDKFNYSVKYVKKGHIISNYERKNKQKLTGSPSMTTCTVALPGVSRLIRGVNID